MKISSLIMILSLIVVVSGIFFWRNGGNHCRIRTPEGDWQLELARTEAEQVRGLMRRKTLCDRCGMLFVFENEKPRTFWMKDTYVPLDIYFYDARGKIADIARDMRPPNETGNPMVYRSKPAKYVLEVGAGSRWDEDLISQCLTR